MSKWHRLPEPAPQISNPNTYYCVLTPLLLQIGSWDAIQESVAKLEAAHRKLEASAMGNTEQVEVSCLLATCFRHAFDKRAARGRQGRPSFGLANRECTCLHACLCFRACSRFKGLT
jgi:hypothetical protein